MKMNPLIFKPYMNLRDFVWSLFDWPVENPVENCPHQIYDPPLYNLSARGNIIIKMLLFFDLPVAYLSVPLVVIDSLPAIAAHIPPSRHCE